MVDDLDMHFNELDINEAARQLVAAISFDTGWMNMPDDFGDYTEALGERIATIDCMLMTLTTVDRVERPFTLTVDDVKEMLAHFAAWMNTLHESGRCGCDEHTK